MARHSLYPNFIKLDYVSNGHTHQQILPVKAVTNTADTHLQTHGGGSTSGEWPAAVDELVALEKVFFHTTDTFVACSLWSLATPTSAPIFIAEADLGTAGTNSGADVAWAQAVLTFRCDAGGRSKLYLMEAVTTPDLRQAYASFDSATKALADYITASTSWLFARNDNAPILALNFTTKINDELRKRYLLDA